MTTIKTPKTAAAQSALFPCSLITWKVLLARGLRVPIVKCLLRATDRYRDTAWSSDIAGDVVGHNLRVVVVWFEAVLIAVCLVSVYSAVRFIFWLAIVRNLSLLTRSQLI